MGLWPAEWCVLFADPCSRKFVEEDGAIEYLQLLHCGDCGRACEPFIAPGNWKCKACGRKLYEGVCMMRCSGCDYNACEQCEEQDEN
jgi:hypothetical protein